MSATNRGAVRHARDFYETPAEAVAPIAPFVPRSTLTIDAGCGSGALGRHWPEPRRWVGVDLVPAVPDDARCYEAIHTTDFLAWEPQVMPQGTVVVMNPPYSLALEFVQHALRLVGPTGHVWALLRLGFLASRRRAEWWQQHPADVYVLSKRPSFTGDGRTDASAYMWANWKPGPVGRWQVV